MKAKKKRVGSILCFGPPPVNDENEEGEFPAEDSTASRKRANRRLIPKIVRSMSLKWKPSDRDEKSPKDPNRSKSRNVSESSKNESATVSCRKNSDASIFSSHLSLSSSSSSFFSPSLEAVPKLPRKKTSNPPPAAANYGNATVLCIMLLPLFVTVFCGRLPAIMWTATCLCLVPRRRTGGRPHEFAVVVPAVAADMRWKGEDYRAAEKKRIVLEGFLQRQKKTMKH